jgi:hypothetical protein
VKKTKELKLKTTTKQNKNDYSSSSSKIWSEDEAEEEETRMTTTTQVWTKEKTQLMPAQDSKKRENTVKNYRLDVIISSSSSSC